MAHASMSARGARRVVSPVLFGTVLFLASESLFFGGLFAAYFALRSITDPWPPAGTELDTVLAAVGTAFLVVSSFTLQAGLGRGERGDHRALVRWTLVTIALAVVFLAIQVYDYLHLGFGVDSHAYGTIYFAMTGFHGLHVIAGVVLLLVLIGRAAEGAYRSGDLTGAHAIAYYWHFVDVVWVLLFATIFLLR
jgi:cytochrome c oxidase subunit 3